MNPQQIQSSLMNLPIFKDMNPQQLVITDKNGNELNNVGSKGKKFASITSLLITLGIIGTIGYFLFTFIIPQVFAALGIVAYYGVILAAIVTGVIMFPLFVRWLKTLLIKGQKALIENDPFIILEQNKQDVKRNKEVFSLQKQKMSGLQKSSENKAYDFEMKAKQSSELVLQYTNQAKALEQKIQEKSEKIGPTFLESDEYFNLTTKRSGIINEGRRQNSLIESYNRYISNYGTRANVLKKFVRKLSLIEIGLEEKMQDLDLSVTLLKEEYQFAADSKSVTSAAKNVLGLSQKWEVDYALEVAANTISYNISQTVANLEDISKATDLLARDIDDESAMKMLEAASMKIESGNLFIPSANAFKSESYQFTSEDERNAGQFGRLI